jgi:chemotaxis protein methyltransferase CheR
MRATLQDEDYDLLRDYLASTAGLVFAEHRRDTLAAIVADRLAATGTADLRAYVATLGEPGGERERLLDAVTVQETQFFRNLPQMDALRSTVLPELARRTAGRRRPLTVWSAGCSTGEEAYTLAMLLIETYGRTSPPVRVIGTDVSASALRTAQQATYSGRTLAAVPPTTRERFFRPGPGPTLVVGDDVRALVELRAHNLVTDPPPFGPGEVDLLVCRNVTIYFSRPTTRSLIGRFHDALGEDGYLLLGHSETLWQLSDAFSLLPVGDAFVYRKGAAAARTPPQAAAAGIALVAPRGARRRPRPARAVPRPATASLAPAPVSPHRAVAAPDLLDAARRALSAGDYADAARLAQAACAGEPLLAEAYVVLGHALSTMALDEAALDALRKAVYLEPGHGIAHFLLGGALARLGQHSLAAVSYRAAAATLPGTRPATVEAYLGGRAVADLVEVCERLARSSAELSAAEGPVSRGRSAS